MSSLKNSITMDSSPEGHNQYSGGSGRAEKEAKAGSKALKKVFGKSASGPQGASQAAFAATKVANKANTAKAHTAANAAHSKAAQEWHRAGGPEGERQAQAHESAAHTHSMAASALRASK